MVAATAYSHSAPGTSVAATGQFLGEHCPQECWKRLRIQPCLWVGTGPQASVFGAGPERSSKCKASNAKHRSQTNTGTGLLGSGSRVLEYLLAGKNLSFLCLDVRGYWKTGIETREGTTRRAVSAEEHHSRHTGCMEMLQSRGSGDCGQ